jgi:hypothetical protein
MYRASLMFANTLMHEIAHAYNSWFHGEEPEPLRNILEKCAELGYSWENLILDRVMVPLHVNDEDFT